MKKGNCLNGGLFIAYSMRLEYQMLEQFKNGYVTIENKTYSIKVYQLEGDESPYCGGIEVKLEQ